MIRAFTEGIRYRWGIAVPQRTKGRRAPSSKTIHPKSFPRCYSSNVPTRQPVKPAPVPNVQQQIDTLTKRVDQMEKQMSTIASAIQTYTQQVEADYTSVENSLTTIQLGITSLNSQIAALQASIAAGNSTLAPADAAALAQIVADGATLQTNATALAEEFPTPPPAPAVTPAKS